MERQAGGRERPRRDLRQRRSRTSASSSPGRRVSLPITSEARMLQVSPASTATDLVSPVRVRRGSRGPAERRPDFRARDTGRRASGRGRRRLGRSTALTRCRRVLARAIRQRGRRRVRGGGRAARDTGHPRADHRAADERGELTARPRLHRRTGAMQDAAGRGRRERRTVGDLDQHRCAAARQVLPARRSAVRRPPPFDSRRPEPGSASTPCRPGVRAGLPLKYGRPPDPYAAYGYEAMALVLDSIERAGSPSTGPP